MKVETQAVNCHLPALVTSGLETQPLRDALWGKKLVVVTTLVNVSHTTNILLHHTFIILKSKVAVITYVVLSLWSLIDTPLRSLTRTCTLLWLDIQRLFMGRGRGPHI